MRAYSLDIRKRIVKAVVEDKQSIPAVAKRFDVSRWSVKRYVRRASSDDLAETKRLGPPLKLSEAGFKLLRQQVNDYPDWTLEQHAEALSESEGVAFKKSVIGKYLKLMSITIKKDVLPPRT